MNKVYFSAVKQINYWYNMHKIANRSVQQKTRISTHCMTQTQLSSAMERLGSTGT